MAYRGTTGALEPPAGVTPDFAHPANRNAQILVVAGCAITITTVFTALRTYTRMIVMRRRQLEDYLLLIAWFFAVVYFLMMPLGIPYKIGVHQWDVSRPAFSEFVKRSNIADIVYSVASCMLKTAILVQLWRIFVVGRGLLFWVVAGLCAFNGLFYLSIMLSRILECVPRERIWSPDVPGHCINNEAAIVSSAVVNVILDISLLLIPLIRTWRLQMRRGDKVVVIGVFGAGAFACIASIMRLVESAHLLLTGDETYTLTDVGLWCDAEIATGIICCCLPVMPRLYRARIATFVSTLKTRLFSSPASTPAPDEGSSNPPVQRSDSETEMIPTTRFEGELYLGDSVNSTNVSISASPDGVLRQACPDEVLDRNIGLHKTFRVTYSN